MLLNPRDDRDHDVRDRVYARVYDHGRGRVYDHVCVCAYGHDRHLHGNARGELYLIKVLHPQDRQW